MKHSNPRELALVTGGSSGIGAVYAERLAVRGYDLIVVGRREQHLRALADRLQASNEIRVEVEVANLAAEADASRIEQIVSERSQLSLIVNNAGSGALGPTAQADIAAVEAMLRVNVNALTRLSLAAGRRFAREGRGTIINIGSVLSLMPAATAAAYAGSKSYVLNFTRSLHDDLSPSGVKVQAVLPGPVRSEFFGDVPPPFPDAMFMSAEDLVDAALAGLDRGETLTIPTLDDTALADRLEERRAVLAAAIMRGGDPAARYRPR